MKRYSYGKSPISVTALAVAGAILVSGAALTARLVSQADTTPPVISGTATSTFSSTTATITWTTDEPADGQVEYGLADTGSYSNKSAVDTTMTTSHTIFISGLTPGSLYEYRAKSKDAAGNIATSERKIVQPPPLPPSDNAPTVTLSVTPTNTQAGHRPGGRSYFTATVSDDKLIKSVTVWTSPMMYSGSPNTLYQCIDKTFCEEKVYIIVPTNAGENFVTLEATDSAGQKTTKTVTFQAPACSTDADCGGDGNVQWAGSSFCGTDSPNIMQYGVGPTCSSGKCNTESTLRTKQQCGAGTMCTYDYNQNNICIAQPAPCTVGAQIASACSCGNSAYNYPYDWRVKNSPTFCCKNGDNNFYTVSPGPCSIVTAPAPVQTSTNQGTTPRTGSAATVTTSASQTTGTAAPAGGSYSTATTPSPIIPAIPGVVPGTVQPTATSTTATTEGEPAAERLRPSQIRTLTMRKKVILRQLDSVERTAKRQKNKDVLGQIREMRSEITVYVPADQSAYDMILDWADELGALREELGARPVILKSKKAR